MAIIFNETTKLFSEEFFIIEVSTYGDYKSSHILTNLNVIILFHLSFSRGVQCTILILMRISQTFNAVEYLFTDLLASVFCL